jgi:thiol-disulfide isomerase/thioredoxin
MRCGTVRRVMTVALVSLSVAPVALAACSKSEPEAEPSRSTAASRQLPAVTLSDLDGRPVELRSLLGQPLVVNFWYSTCPPCITEMPALAEVAAEFGSSVRFVGVNPQDSADVARAFASERGATYEQLLDHTGVSVDGLSLTGFPSTVLVAADGTIEAIERRALTSSSLRELIEEHFE